MIRTLVLDLDGVILKDPHGTSSLEGDLFKKAFSVSGDDFKKNFTKKFYKPCQVGEENTEFALRKAAEQLNMKISGKHLLRWWLDNQQDSLTDLGKHLPSFRMPLYIATNQDVSRWSYLNQKFNFSSSISGAFVSGKIGYRKPDSRFYNYCQTIINNDFDCHRSEVLFVDDRLINTEAAQAYGWQSLSISQSDQALEQVLSKLNIDKN